MSFPIFSHDVLDFEFVFHLLHLTSYITQNTVSQLQILVLYVIYPDWWRRDRVCEPVVYHATPVNGEEDAVKEATYVLLKVSIIFIRL